MAKKKTTKKKQEKLITKKTEKKIRLGATILISVIVIIALTLFFLGIKIKFFLDDELNIKLDPKNPVLNTVNNKEARVTFTVENDNFVQCKSRCNIKLISLKDYKTVSEENITLEHGEKINREYSLLPPKKGSGQQIYNFEAKCSNIKSVICPTSGIERYKSSIIILNYELQEEEEQIKKEYYQKLKSFENELENISIKIKQTGILLENLKKAKEKEELALSLSGLKDSLKTLEETKSLFLSYWDKEDYHGLKEKYSEKIKLETKRLSDELEKIKAEITSLSELREDSISKTKEFQQKKETIKEALNHYFLYNNKEKYEALKILNQRFYASFITLKDSAKFSEKETNDNLKNNLEKINQILSEYSQEKNKGLYILNFNSVLLSEKNNKSQGNITEFSCQELNKTIEKVKTENLNSASILNSGYQNKSSEPNFLNKLKEIEENITKKALEKTKQKIIESKLIPKEKESLINYLENNIKIKNISAAYEGNTTKEEFYKLSSLNYSLGEKFYSEFCTKSKENIISENNTSVTEILSLIDYNLIEKINQTIPEIKINFTSSVGANPDICCVFSDCRPCGEKRENINPVLFIHGHAFNDANTPDFSMNAFTKIQSRMQENGFINAGEFDFDDISKGEWSKAGIPFTVRASYYYIVHYKVGDYSIDAQKSERIENYAIRLKETIDLLKYRTGSSKVNIIAHSMGGLVAREYLNLFGSDSLDKLIMVNTPNHGVTANIKKFCSFLGAQKECNDMSEGSIFLTRLNSKEPPKDADIRMIRSVGCIMDKGELGDGIVTNKSAYLPGVKNYEIEGKCTDSFKSNLHSMVLDPDIYPQTYDLIVKILKEERSKEEAVS